MNTANYKEALISYKEGIKHGENIPFFLSKKKMLLCSILFILFAFLGLVMIIAKGPFLQKVFGIVFFFLFGYLGIMFVKPLLRPQMPPVISLNKDFLEIFLNPLGENSPFISIPWSEILDIYMEVVKGSKGQKTYYLALKCTDAAIQHIQNQIEQTPAVSIKVCFIKSNIVLLNISNLLDISTSDLLNLLTEIHKEVTAAQQ